MVPLGGTVTCDASAASTQSGKEHFFLTSQMWCCHIRMCPAMSFDLATSKSEYPSESDAYFLARRRVAVVLCVAAKELDLRHAFQLVAYFDGQAVGVLVIV